MLSKVIFLVTFIVSFTVVLTSKNENLNEENKALSNDIESILPQKNNLRQVRDTDDVLLKNRNKNSKRKCFIDTQRRGSKCRKQKRNKLLYHGVNSIKPNDVNNRGISLKIRDNELSKFSRIYPLSIKLKVENDRRESGHVVNTHSRDGNRNFDKEDLTKFTHDNYPQNNMRLSSMFKRYLDARNGLTKNYRHNGVLFQKDNLHENDEINEPWNHKENLNKEVSENFNNWNPEALRNNLGNSHDQNFLHFQIQNQTKNRIFEDDDGYEKQRHTNDEILHRNLQGRKFDELGLDSDAPRINFENVQNENNQDQTRNGIHTNGNVYNRPQRTTNDRVMYRNLHKNKLEEIGNGPDEDFMVFDDNLNSDESKNNFENIQVQNEFYVQNQDQTGNKIHMSRNSPQKEPEGLVNGPNENLNVFGVSWGNNLNYNSSINNLNKIQNQNNFHVAKQDQNGNEIHDNGQTHYNAQRNSNYRVMNSNLHKKELEGHGNRQNENFRHFGVAGRNTLNSDMPRNDFRNVQDQNSFNVQNQDETRNYIHDNGDSYNREQRNLDYRVMQSNLPKREIERFGNGPNENFRDSDVIGRNNLYSGASRNNNLKKTGNAQRNSNGRYIQNNIAKNMNDPSTKYWNSFEDSKQHSQEGERLFGNIKKDHQSLNYKSYDEDMPQNYLVQEQASYLDNDQNNQNINGNDIVVDQFKSPNKINVNKNLNQNSYGRGHVITGISTKKRFPSERRNDYRFSHMKNIPNRNVNFNSGGHWNSVKLGKTVENLYHQNHLPKINSKRYDYDSLRVYREPKLSPELAQIETEVEEEHYGNPNAGGYVY